MQENARNLFVHLKLHISISACRFFLCSARRVDGVKGRKLLTFGPFVDGLMDVQEPSVAGGFGI